MSEEIVKLFGWKVLKTLFTLFGTKNLDKTWKIELEDKAARIEIITHLNVKTEKNHKKVNTFVFLLVVFCRCRVSLKPKLK